MNGHKSKIYLALIGFGVGTAVILYAIISGSPVRKVALPGGTSIEFGDKPTPVADEENTGSNTGPVVTTPEPVQLPAPPQNSSPAPTPKPQPYESYPYDSQVTGDFDEVMRQTDGFIDCLEAGHSQCSVYGQ